MEKRSNIRKAFPIFLLLMLVIIQLSSCGVTEYRTPHECGTYVVGNYDDFDRLAFKYGTSATEVSKIIPNFCIYRNSRYTACVPLDMKNWNVPSDFEQWDSTVEDAVLYLHFNDDKEFTDFIIYFGDNSSRAAFLQKIIFSFRYSRDYIGTDDGDDDGYLRYNFINGDLTWINTIPAHINEVTYYGYFPND